MRRRPLASQQARRAAPDGQSVKHRPDDGEMKTRGEGTDSIPVSGHVMGAFRFRPETRKGSVHGPRRRERSQSAGSRNTAPLNGEIAHDAGEAEPESFLVAPVLTASSLSAPASFSLGLGLDRRWRASSNQVCVNCDPTSPLIARRPIPTSATCQASHPLQRIRRGAEQQSPETSNGDVRHRHRSDEQLARARDTESERRLSFTVSASSMSRSLR